MKKNRGFTLIELLVVIAIIALLIGILVPALGAARRAANKMKNGTQIRAIGNSLVVWSDQFYQQSQDFPKKGLVPAPPNYTLLTTNEPALRIAALCNMGSDPLGAQMLINPVGTDVASAQSAPSIALNTTEPVMNLSYAVIEALNPEWKNKTNAGCVMLGDRQKPTGTKASFWNTKYWEGGCGWGDTHVSYESGQTTASWPTTTVNGTTNANPTDDLFAGGGGTYTDVLLVNPGGGDK